MRRQQILFIGVMTAIVVAMWVQMAAPYSRTRPLLENRLPAPFPDIVQKTFHGDGRLSAGINAWFDDRIGFRSLLTRLANQIDYSVFSYSRRALIGRDGWVFDKDFFAKTIETSRTSDGLKIERQKLALIVAFLKRRNIRLVIISTPAKETVYREFLPARIPSGPTTSEFEKFRAYLNAGDGRDWIHIDSQAVVMNAKGDNINLYFRMDPHATTYGTVPVAKALVKRLADAEGIDLKWDPLLDLVFEENQTGAELRFLSTFSPRSEWILESRVTTRFDLNPPPGHVFENAPPQPFEVAYHNETGRPTLPPALIFGSSFLDRFLMFDTYANFSHVYRARGISDYIGDGLRNIPAGTRYFIYQFWEPDMSALRFAKIPTD